MALLNCLKFINTNNKLREITTNDSSREARGDLITGLRLQPTAVSAVVPWPPVGFVYITGYWCPPQQCRNLLWPCPSSSPPRERRAVREFQASLISIIHFPHMFLLLILKNLWPSTLRAAQVPSSGLFQSFLSSEIQEDVSLRIVCDSVWLLSQESEAWWIHCQFWGMVFSPYFHYEPGCRLLINFLHWYQFIFTSRGSDVFGKGHWTAELARLDRPWLHLVSGKLL